MNVFSALLQQHALCLGSVWETNLCVCVVSVSVPEFFIIPAPNEIRLFVMMPIIDITSCVGSHTEHTHVFAILYVKSKDTLRLHTIPRKIC